jgi:hypothetical protein
LPVGIWEFRISDSVLIDGRAPCLWSGVMPKKPKPATQAPSIAAGPGTSPIFAVAFEYARRSFKCVLVDWPAPDGHSTKQWVVTVAGRAVWSFEAGTSDTRESVQREVERWWDSQKP